MAMIRSNFPDLFDSRLAAIDTVYLQSRDLDETKAAWKKIFAVRSSNRQFENVTGVSGFPQFIEVGEAGDVPLMRIQPLYDKKFLHTKWAGAWEVSEEAEDDDQDEVIAGNARAFARAFRFTKEVNLAGVLNNSTTTELSADGAAIGATHTLSDGSTKANNVATDFGVSAAQTMFNHFASLNDDQGLRIHASPAYIVANPAMRWVIGEVMKSEYSPYTATNAKNVLYEEMLQEVYWAEVSDTDAWYVSMKPQDLNGNGARLYNRQDFTTSSDFNVRSLSLISVGRGRWSRGVIDWRQFYVSTGA